MTLTLLHMPLDQLHDPSQFDIGPQRRSVRVEGNPRAVVDDRLGAAVQFDQDDALSTTLTDLGTAASQDLTISFWMAPRMVPDSNAVVASLGDAAKGGMALMLAPVTSSEVGLFLESGGTSAKPVPVPLDAWRNLAVVRTAGNWQLMIDGSEAQKAADTRDLSDTILRLGSPSGVTEAGQFDLAQLRVTKAALAPAKLSSVLNEDQTPFGVFRDENPLNLRLLDPDGAPNIYIGTPRKLMLELQNQGSTDLVFSKGRRASAQLRFILPEGTLHPNLLSRNRSQREKFRVDGNEWDTRVSKSANGVIATLTPKVDKTLKPGDAMVLSFMAVRAEPGFGTRAVRTLLEYDAVFGGEPVSGTRAKLLNVINQTGQSNVPLRAEISSSDLLPVGGTTSLVLKVTNTSTRKIVFEDRGGAARFDDADQMPDEPSSTLTVVLPRELDANGPTPDAVLAENGAPTLPTIDNWAVEMRTDVPWACWLRITPTGGDRVLKGGETVEIPLADLPVSPHSGPGVIRVIHSHLRDFWYGEAELALRKAGLSYGDDGVLAHSPLTISGGETQDATAYFYSGKEATGEARACYLSFHPGDAPSSIVQVTGVEFNIITNLDNMHIGTPGTGYLYHKDGYFELGRDERVTWTKDGVTIGPKLTVTGDVTINGDLTATNKHFAIPHPHDPQARLVHAVIESPESAVSYRGTGQLEGGRVEIELPHYFEALTQPGSATVHLTAKGRIPFLLSADEVIGNRVNVFGTVPDGAFAWEVRATRRGAGFEIEPQPETERNA